MQNDGFELLKVDSLGRVRVTAQRREALLDAFERCGVSATQFAARAGLKYTTFATWRQRRDRQRQTGGAPGGGLPVAPAPPRTEMRWVEAVPEAPDGGKQAPVLEHGVLYLVLPCGGRLEIGGVAQAKLAAVLLRELESGRRKGC